MVNNSQKEELYDIQTDPAQRNNIAAGKTAELSVKPGSKGVVFELDLPAGPTKRLTHLYNKKGQAGGAYFTEVELLK